MGVYIKGAKIFLKNYCANIWLGESYVNHIQVNLHLLYKHNELELVIVRTLHNEASVYLNQHVAKWDWS